MCLYALSSMYSLALLIVFIFDAHKTHKYDDFHVGDLFLNYKGSYS